MERFLNLALVGILALGIAFFGSSVTYAEEGAPTEANTCPNFVDENGDGYNDNAPDHDKDGIPNGVDSDYVKPGIGMGPRGFVDEDGDGVNDLAGSRDGAMGRGGFWQRMASRLKTFAGGNGKAHAGGSGFGERLRERDEDCLSSGDCPQDGTGSQIRGRSGGNGNQVTSGAGNVGRGGRNGSQGQ